MADAAHNEELDQIRHNLSRLSAVGAASSSSAADDFHRDELSMRRLSASLSSTQNSQAVVSALRSLQDKIRRLETECTFYKDAYESTKRAAFEARDEAEERIAKIQTAFHSEREALARERNELIISVNALREQVRALEKELALAKDSLQRVDIERRTAEVRAKDAEAQRENTERGASSSITDLQCRIRELEARLNEREARAAQLHQAFDTEHAHRLDLEARDSRLEAALREIVRINENLVDRVGKLEQAEPSSGGSKGSKGLKAAMGKKPRTASASRARKDGTSTGVNRPKTAAPCASSAEGFRAQMRRVSALHDLPFLLGTNTGPSFNTVAILQSTSRSTTPVKSRDGPSDESPFTSHQMPPRHEEAQAAAEKGDGRFVLDRSEKGERAEKADKRREKSISLSSSGRIQMNAHATPVDDDVDEVIHSLTEEYDTLNSEYQLLLRQTQDVGASFSSGDIQLMTKLRHVIDLMERKGQQLRHLKAYRRAMETSLREAKSPPPTFPNAEKRKKALELYRNLRDLDQSM